MARSEEKAMSILNRWIDQKAAAAHGGLSLDPMPRDPSECSDVRRAEYFRGRVTKELVSMIERIQDASLDEVALRQLNIDVNRQVALRDVWNKRVLFLGGKELPDVDQISRNAVKVNGFMYFGRAKELPEAMTGLSKAKTLTVPSSHLDERELIAEGIALKNQLTDRIAKSTSSYPNSHLLQMILRDTAAEDILTSSVEVVPRFKEASRQMREFFRQKQRVGSPS